jgi:hypothetical protein
MNDISYSHDLVPNMHVGLPSELGEDELARLKPAHRAILAARLEQVWQACEPYVQGPVLSGGDARMVDLGLKCLDRLMRLYEVTEADRAGSETEVVLTATAGRRAAALAALEARAAVLNAE